MMQLSGANIKEDGICLRKLNYRDRVSELQPVKKLSLARCSIPGLWMNREPCPSLCGNPTHRGRMQFNGANSQEKGPRTAAQEIHRVCECWLCSSVPWGLIQKWSHWIKWDFLRSKLAETSAEAEQGWVVHRSFSKQFSMKRWRKTPASAALAPPQSQWGALFHHYMPSFCIPLPTYQFRIWNSPVKSTIQRIVWSQNCCVRSLALNLSSNPMFFFHPLTFSY